MIYHIRENIDGMKAFKLLKTLKTFLSYVQHPTRMKILLNFPETFFYLEKPVNPKELKLTVEMEIYKHQMEMALARKRTKIQTPG